MFIEQVVNGWTYLINKDLPSNCKYICTHINTYILKDLQFILIYRTVKAYLQWPFWDDWTFSTAYWLLISNTAVNHQHLILFLYKSLTIHWYSILLSSVYSLYSVGSSAASVQRKTGFTGSHIRISPFSKSDQVTELLKQLVISSFNQLFMFIESVRVLLHVGFM